MKRRLLFAGLFLIPVCITLFSYGQEDRIIRGSELFKDQKPAEKKPADTKESKEAYYIVQPGDGWYSIARKHNITYPELRLANQDTDDKLFPGKKIRIPGNNLKPTDPYFEKNYTDSVKKKDSGKPVYHSVAKGQTLFSISRLYNVSVENIKQWNNLKSNSIEIGQRLIVSKTTVAPEPIKEEPAKIVIIDSTPVAVENKVPAQDSTPAVELIEVPEPPKTPAKVITVSKKEKEKINAQVIEMNETPAADESVIFGNGFKQVTENGVAEIMDEESPGTERYYALHRTAPVGTIIRVLNLSNSRKLYVKVIGNLPETPENEGILIRVSKDSAEKLVALERIIQVNLLYGMKE